MADTQDDDTQLNFMLDANKTPVLYADSYLIGSNEHVLTLNFGQAMPEPSQQNIVSRIALTREQAKEFLTTLQDHIGKFEV